LIVSNDSIKMKPPYEITAEILKLIVSVSEKIGEVNAKYLVKQNPTLRKQNKLNHSALKVQRFVLRGTESPSFYFIQE